MNIPTPQNPIEANVEVGANAAMGAANVVSPNNGQARKPPPESAFAVGLGKAVGPGPGGMPS